MTVGAGFTPALQQEAYYARSQRFENHPRNPLDLGGHFHRASPLRRLGVKVGRREIGHIHGDSLVDIPFPKKIRDEIVAAGQAEPPTYTFSPRVGLTACSSNHFAR